MSNKGVYSFIFTTDPEIIFLFLLKRKEIRSSLLSDQIFYGSRLSCIVVVRIKINYAFYLFSAACVESPLE